MIKYIVNATALELLGNHIDIIGRVATMNDVKPVFPIDNLRKLTLSLKSAVVFPHVPDNAIGLREVMPVNMNTF